MTNPFWTAFLTIFGGIIVYVSGQIIVRFLVDPYQEYRKLVGEIADALVYYGNVSANANNELKEAASTTFRQKGSLLRVRAHQIVLLRP